RPTVAITLIETDATRMTDETKLKSWLARVFIAAMLFYAFGVVVTFFVLAFLQGLGPESPALNVLRTWVYAFLWPGGLIYWLTGVEVPYFELVVSLILIAVALWFWLLLLYLAYAAIRLRLDKKGLSDWRSLWSATSRLATEARSKPARTLRRTGIVLGWSAIVALLIVDDFAVVRGFASAFRENQNLTAAG